MEKKSQVYGLRAIIEAVEAGQAIQKVYLQKGLKGTLAQELESLLRKENISTSYVPVEKLNRLSKNNHQGAIANISPVSFSDFETMVEKVVQEKKEPFFLLLDGVTDVRNFGAIIRTAECCGVDGIVIPKQGSAPVTDDTVKTSAGAAFSVPIAKIGHLKDAIFYLQSNGINIVAATEKSKDDLFDLDVSGPCAIVMGAEDTGISPSILKAADKRAKIPLMGKIGSLNVSVACGVFLYEVVRQRLN
ncbi:23S rRNA (guanosine(2251)-2'-O)-methyltransferase RlmB [Flagellimonas meridianipacifica]|uniref:23S rRNA (Guanosine2251-2'-O)-methyltransferase n=1 Tax=Flagellimonas meridianipacifica TaxID=1080225 RepID=A0A2T0M876_9FLAO|nr:23S rRNA (guanosine(2251)-2'-O)-methyltransferase RlmB [Allomuricauda pacifica]PRX53690.1 23S rRNA (guanosine2251-2'-O)-methyltransferase [Allomuricauda pacifica]